MVHKKKKILTSTDYGMRVEAAISAFRAVVTELRAANKEAEDAKEENLMQIVELQAENEALAAAVDRNNQVVSNIEKLLNL